MAELQIWCNKTLDTASQVNRRLFLDHPKKTDDSGQQVPDTSKPLQPVPPGVAARALGEPDVVLHGTTNWKRGTNTGTSGYKLDSGGNRVINPAGQFTPHGKIEKFVPDPKLNQ
jgi:hypothetical protein